VGSGKEELQAEAIAIFKLAAHYNILIEPEWLPREQNEVADYLSRIVDYDDWEMLHGGVWEELLQIKDPKLLPLVQGLKRTVLNSRAGSTIRKYTGAFSRWKQRADDQSGIQSFPVVPLHFTLYLQHLSDQAQSRAAVEEAINAVSWVNQAMGLQPISQDPFVKTVAAGLQQALAKPKKKEPVTAAMLRDLVDAAGLTPSLSSTRTIAMAVIAFAAFLRFDEP
uniref:Uncharacterized protein n=1 Tax=Amphimedon queenslandica TaxID=400682 RepID=A0A1X7VSD4_AMPQE